MNSAVCGSDLNFTDYTQGRKKKQVLWAKYQLNSKFVQTKWAFHIRGAGRFYFCFMSLPDLHLSEVSETILALKMSYFLMQMTHLVPSRRKCLACLCANLALLNVSVFSICLPNGIALDMVDGTLEKEKTVCRNCGGTGAIICKEPAPLCFFPFLFRIFVTILFDLVSVI